MLLITSFRSEGRDTNATLADLDAHVRVTAGGRLVFHLQGQRAQYEHLRELQASIDEAERALAEAERRASSSRRGSTPTSAP